MTATELLLPLAPARRRLPRDRHLATRVWWRRGELDRRLAQGEDPTTSPELELRATQLTRPDNIDDLADRLAELPAAADESHTGSSAAVPLQRDQIRAARRQLTALTEALRRSGAGAPHGVARAELLFSDCASPLNAPAQSGRLARELREITDTIEPTARMPRAVLIR